MAQILGAGENAAASSFSNYQEVSLYPPPTPHWFQGSVSSKQQFLIGWHCLHKQSLVSQAVLNRVLLWEMLLQLHGSPRLPRGSPAVPATQHLWI